MCPSIITKGLDSSDQERFRLHKDEILFILTNRKLIYSYKIQSKEDLLVSLNKSNLIRDYSIFKFVGAMGAGKQHL